MNIRQKTNKKKQNTRQRNKHWCILTCTEHWHLSRQLGLLRFSTSQSISNSYTARYAETQRELKIKKLLHWMDVKWENSLWIKFFGSAEGLFTSKGLTMYATFASWYTTDWAPSSTSFMRPVNDRQRIDFRAAFLQSKASQSGLWHYLLESLQSHMSTIQHIAWPCQGQPGGCMSPSPGGTLETNLRKCL